MNLALVLLGGALTCIGMGIGAMLINWRISRRPLPVCPKCGTRECLLDPESLHW